MICGLICGPERHESVDAACHSSDFEGSQKLLQFKRDGAVCCRNPEIVRGCLNLETGLLLELPLLTACSGARVVV